MLSLASVNLSFAVFTNSAPFAIKSLTIPTNFSSTAFLASVILFCMFVLISLNLLITFVNISDNLVPMKFLIAFQMLSSNAFAFCICASIAFFIAVKSNVTKPFKNASTFSNVPLINSHAAVMMSEMNVKMLLIVSLIIPKPLITISLINSIAVENVSEMICHTSTKKSDTLVHSCTKKSTTLLQTSVMPSQTETANSAISSHSPT